MKSGVRDPPEATLSVPRPSILRNPSYVVLPLSSPVRKSVAFDEEIAVDIPQPQAFADQRPPQSDASSPRGTTLESDTKPSVTIPLADVSTDTSTSADSEDESVNTTTHSPPDMTARSQTSSRTRSYLESPARETTVKPETTPDKSPGKVVLTKEKDMQREGFVAQQSMLPHANSLPRPGRASRQSSRTSRRSRDEIKVTPSMPTRVPASKPFSDMREDSLVAEGTVLPNASVPEDRPPIKSSLPPEALAQPVIMENVLYDYVRKQNAAGWYYRSGVIMPLLPDVQVLSLSCERVTRSLHRCRDSTVYKRLRKLIWRFHLDLEDLNKIRQRQWVELAETCIALVNRMMEDLSQGHTFRDRWDRKRYAHILGDAHGRDPNTIFFMFGASIPFMHLGARYCQEAKSVLQMVSARTD